MKVTVTIFLILILVNASSPPGQVYNGQISGSGTQLSGINYGGDDDGDLPPNFSYGGTTGSSNTTQKTSQTTDANGNVVTTTTITTVVGGQTNTSSTSQTHQVTQQGQGLMYTVLKDREFKETEAANGTQQVYDSLFNDIQEFAVQGWFKITKGSKRGSWSTGFHFNGNKKAQDLAAYGDRTLSYFVINNTQHFATYDLNTQNRNLNGDINFEAKNEGIWQFLYFGYSPSLMKAFGFQVFQNSTPKTKSFGNVKHQVSSFYTLFVGQSFQYKNYPGRIMNLSLCAGVNCYREQGFVGTKIINGNISFDDPTVVATTSNLKSIKITSSLIQQKSIKKNKKNLKKNE